MESGNFNRRVTIQRIELNPETDDHGEVDLTDDANWETYAVRWAAVKNMSGREWWKSNKINAEVTLIIKIPYDRFTQNINSKMRIRLGDRTINIVAVTDPDEMHEVIEMQCKEQK